MPSAPIAAEEVQRPRHVLQQEADRQQVEEHAERARDPVVALAALAGTFLIGISQMLAPYQLGQRRNEAVHLAIERNVLDDLAAIGLERRAEVVDVHAARASPSASWRSAKEYGA